MEAMESNQSGDSAAKMKAMQDELKKAQAALKSEKAKTDSLNGELEEMR